MPSNGLLSFLPELNPGPDYPKNVCQCPLTGFSHFYETAFAGRRNWYRVCQCPLAGFSHFYRTLTLLKGGHEYCVNALWRASLISTVPSGKPLFIRLPSSIFVSNSQNILIFYFFRLFFWLVTFFFYFSSSHFYFSIYCTSCFLCCSKQATAVSRENPILSCSFFNIAASSRPNSHPISIISSTLPLLSALLI